MVPIAGTLVHRRPWDQVEVFGALETLIRAGGQPAAAFPAVVRGLEVERTRRAAGSVLRQAALHGHPLHDALDALAPYARDPDPDLREAHALAALQHAGMGDVVSQVAAVIRHHRPMATFHGALGLIEHQLLDGAPAEVVQARVALDALVEAGPELRASWRAVEPVIRTQLASAEPFWQREAALAAGRAPIALRGADRPAEGLDALVEALARCASHSDDGVAGHCARALGALVEFGASLAAVQTRVEEALDDPREAVRSASSRALSAWRADAGLEARLPAGFSHRRTWATSDDPIEGPCACPHCQAPSAAVIHRWRQRRQFGEDHRVEVHCRTCGVYSIEEHGIDL
jgi:hypothetical protein